MACQESQKQLLRAVAESEEGEEDGRVPDSLGELGSPCSRWQCVWRTSLRTGMEFLNQRIVTGLPESVPSKGHPHISPTLTVR